MTDAPQTEQVASAAAHITILERSWPEAEQSVSASGSPVDPGDAGELAVTRYGRALERLADL